MRSHTTSLASALCVLVVLFGVGAGRAQAQQKFQVLGPNQCLNCHDHEREHDWYSNKELLEVVRLFPAKGANAGHINSLNQLETPKSNDFAKAIGLADKYDANGACVRCHATVFNGDANAGVSCESCHGPSSGYLLPHQTKGAYEQSVAQFGMTKLVGNVQGWTQQCTNCHVMDDDRLIKAGHPSGDDFDLSKKFQPVSLHFKKSYTAAGIDAIARVEMEGIMRRRRPNMAPPAAAPVTPVEPPPPAVAVAEPPPVPPVTAVPPVTTTVTPPVVVTKPAAAPAPKPAPKPVKPKPAPAIDLASPPAGSPTSIEPPPPLPDPNAVAAAPAPAPAPTQVTPPTAPPVPPTAPAEPGLLENPLVWIGALVVVAAAGFAVWRSRAS